MRDEDGDGDAPEPVRQQARQRAREDLNRVGYTTTEEKILDELRAIRALLEDGEETKTE